MSISIVVGILLAVIAALLLLLARLISKSNTASHCHNGIIVAKQYSPAILAIDIVSSDVPFFHNFPEEWILIIRETNGKEVALFVSEKFWQITQVANKVDIPCCKGSFLEPHISNELIFELHQQTKGLRAGVHGVN